MSVEVKLELGHRAVMKEKVTQEGFTHDWTVFVRGAEGNNIHFFVEKVVFHLHESFPKPKRVIKEPPYFVSESGYAGFIMPIDVYFRTREEPKKVTFKYDLYLRLESPPVSNIRIEKLTFQNPSDDFRNKLIKAGGFAGALTGPTAGGSTSLSTQACAPPPHIDEPPVPPVNHSKPVVLEKKILRPHVPSKEIKTSQAPSSKPSQPFTDIFGAPIRTKKSPDSSVKLKDPGLSSLTKTKNSSNSSSVSSVKEGKSSSKESHKSKDNQHSNKEARHATKDSHIPSKDSHPPKDTHSSLKETFLDKESHQPKDSHKEGHHTPKEIHRSKEHHSKESHKKDNHHSSKESKSSKESRSTDSKSSKSVKSEKESKKSVKRPAPPDTHNSHGNVEKKKKLSPISSESTDKSSSQSKHKSKESKEKTEKQKQPKPLLNSIKKEEEKPKHRSSPAPPEPIEPKEMTKLKPNSPKPPSTPPPPVVKQPSTPPKSPSAASLESDSDDESSKSIYNAHYSSPPSSISESSLHSNLLRLSDHSIISPLSDNDSKKSDDFSPPSKRKVSSDYELDDDVSPEPKPLESILPKSNNKKQHVLHKSSKHKSETFHGGNGSIHSDISVRHSPSPDLQNNSNHNSSSSEREELLELQQLIMATNDRKLLQNIVDVIETTGNYEITNTTFDFDLCSLDNAIIQKIKLCVTNCDKYV